MSIKWMASIWEDADVSSTQLIVLLALADYADEDGLSWPRLETLARKSRISKRQVQRVLEELEGKGNIRIISRKDAAGRSLTNHYQLARIGSQIDTPGGHSYVQGEGDIAMSTDPSVLDPSVNTSCRQPSLLETDANASACADAQDISFPVDAVHAKRREQTPQQEYFEAICKCVGWDYKVLTKEQTGQVAQTLGILKRAEYTLSDLSEFRERWFTEDWRGKRGQFPTISQLRAEIGKVRQVQDLDYDSPRTRMNKFQ